VSTDKTIPDNWTQVLLDEYVKLTDSAYVAGTYNAANLLTFPTEGDNAANKIPAWWTEDMSKALNANVRAVTNSNSGLVSGAVFALESINVKPFLNAEALKGDAAPDMGDPKEPTVAGLIYHTAFSTTTDSGDDSAHNYFGFGIITGTAATDTTSVHNAADVCILVLITKADDTFEDVARCGVWQDDAASGSAYVNAGNTWQGATVTTAVNVNTADSTNNSYVYFFFSGATLFASTSVFKQTADDTPAKIYYVTGGADAVTTAETAFNNGVLTSHGNGASGIWTVLTYESKPAGTFKDGWCGVYPATEEAVTEWKAVEGNKCFYLNAVALAVGAAAGIAALF
jgi:hypothetical protein